jgi:L-fuculose-phosphate aldolase
MNGKGLVASNDGNISVRLSKNRVLLTPTGVHKGYLNADELIMVDLEGHILRGHAQPTSETQMHLDVFRKREDVNACVHAHPPTVVAFSIVGLGLAECIIPESIFCLGKVVSVGYATPTTKDVPQILSGYLKDYNVFILDRHGSLTLGSDVYQAYHRLEALEHTAKITFLARQLGTVAPLCTEEVQRITRLVQGGGYSASEKKCTGCNACGRPKIAGAGSGSKAEIDPKMIEIITEKIISQLKG